ncbi:hypothetical protein ABK040_016758 [Willaertia magna]
MDNKQGFIEKYGGAKQPAIEEAIQTFNNESNKINKQTIPKQTFIESLPHELGPGFSELLFDYYDKNKDGEMDLNEFVEYYVNFLRNENEEENTRVMFKLLDKNGDGLITKKELRLISESLTDEEFDELFSSIDIDNDGCIQFEEMLDFARRKDEISSSDDEDEEQCGC